MAQAKITKFERAPNSSPGDPRPKNPELAWPCRRWRGVVSQAPVQATVWGRGRWAGARTGVARCGGGAVVGAPPRVFVFLTPRHVCSSAAHACAASCLPPPAAHCPRRSRTTQRGCGAQQRTARSDGRRLPPSRGAGGPASAVVGSSAHRRRAAQPAEQRRAERRAGRGQEPGSAGAQEARVPDPAVDSPAQAHHSRGRRRAAARDHARPGALGNGHVGAPGAQAGGHGQAPARRLVSRR